MAYVNSDITTGIINSSVNKTIMLNCMGNFCKRTKNVQQKIYNADAIDQRIKHSAKIREQLDADILEIDKRILQSAEAKKQNKML